MEEIKMSLEAIRTNMGLSRSEMADRLKITLDRYHRLANDESRMFASELIRLHDISGVPFANIRIPE